MLATRREADSVGLNDFNMAIERIVAGLEKKNRLLNPEERKVVAYHEIGHALVAMSLPDADAVHKVSIIPRGIGALGYTIQRPTEDRFLMSQGELEHKMAVLLGGRAAEAIVFDQTYTGAADDLAKATEIARSMVTRYGMVKSLGQISYEGDPQGFLSPMPMPTGFDRRYSEETARTIDDAVCDLVDRAFDAATKVLTDKRAVLDQAAQELLQKETLDGEELNRLVGQRSGSETSFDVAATSAPDT